MKKTIIKYPMFWFFFFVASLPYFVQAEGWYWRGNLGYEWSREADFSDSDCSATNPPTLFGCVKGGDGRPLGAYGNFGRFPSAELAVGRRLFPWMRADLALSYRFNMRFEGNANFLAVGQRQPVSATADSFSGMLKFFVDFHGFSAGIFGRFQPYAGCGAGWAYNRIGQMTYLFPENQRAHKISVIPSGDRNNFAFTFTLGTGLVLTEKIILDIAYHYMDLGVVGTSPGNMYMDTRPDGIAISDVWAPLKVQGVAVGMRYNF